MANGNYMSPQVKIKVQEILNSHQEFYPKRSRLQAAKDLIQFFDTLEKSMDWNKMKTCYPVHDFNLKDNAV